MQAQTTTSDFVDQFEPAEANALFEATAQRYLNLSGAEFLQKWDSGTYADSPSKTRAMRVAMLIPMVRTTSAGKNAR